MTQMSEIDLGVDASGFETTMPKQVTDRFQGHALIDETSGTGVAKSVRSSVPNRMVQGLPVTLDDSKDGGTGQRTERVASSKKNLSTSCTRPYFSEITQNGRSDTAGEGKDLGAARLATLQMEKILFPVNVFKAQRPHLARTQSVKGQQHEDGSITNDRGMIPFGAGQEPLDIIPGRAGRKCLLPEHAWGHDGVCQAGPAQTMPLRVSKEHSQARRVRLNRSTSISVPVALARQGLIDLSDPDVAKRKFGVGGAAKKVFDDPTVLLDGCARQAPFLLHVLRKIRHELGKGKLFGSEALPDGPENGANW